MDSESEVSLSPSQPSDGEQSPIAATGETPHSPDSGNSAQSGGSYTRARSKSKSASMTSLSDIDEPRSPSPVSSSSDSSDNEDESANARNSSRSPSPAHQSKTSSKRSRSRSRSASASSSSSSASSKDENNAVTPASPDSNSNISLSSAEESGSAGSRSNSRSRSASVSKQKTGNGAVNLNISHEDLSDVSDVEHDKRNNSNSLNASILSDEIEQEQNDSLKDDDASKNELHRQEDAAKAAAVVADVIDAASIDMPITDLRQKLDFKKSQQKDLETAKQDENTNGSLNSVRENLEDVLVKADDEDALDFEAEEGECPDVKDDENEQQKAQSTDVADGKKTQSEREEGEELEEGEVSDEDEKRPEETEPKPVCRFYTRGQCTWGMSCRFLHPGVTDKGNYTMFDLVRPVSLPQQSAAVGGVGMRGAGYAPPAHAVDFHDFRERPPIHHRLGALHHAPAVYAPTHEPRAALLPDGPVVVESAWERGLRTAKEMMRKANKRKEQDMDFEDKKMNLTLSADELEKDPYYIKERVTPDALPAPAYARHGAAPAYADAHFHSPERYARGAAASAAAPYEDVDLYGRNTRYRELPAHRMPQYEDDRRVRPTREVIVQRVESSGRADDWNDPWMRRKSPGRLNSRDRAADKRRRNHRSYSSNSSYSSSSSSQSESSSDSSRSPSPGDHRRRYNSNAVKSPPISRKHGARAARSPSSTMRRARRSPDAHHGANKRRNHLSPSSGADKRRGAYSPPAHKRKKLGVASYKKSHGDAHKTIRLHSSSSSGSGSSDSSGSDSDSESVSSTSGTSGSASGGRSQTKRAHATADKKAAKKPAETAAKRTPISIELKKTNTVGASALAHTTSPTHAANDKEPPKKKSRRDELLKQLRAVEEAIAKKKQKM